MRAAISDLTTLTIDTHNAFGEHEVNGKQSKYVEAGSPNFCRLPSCQHRLLVRATHGSDGHYYCRQRCADEGRNLDFSNVEVCADGGLSKRAAQIFTVSECIDHCFAFEMWCSDFVQNIDPDDMMMGLDRAHDLVSDATRLLSFLALRKLDEFFKAKKSKPDDLIASELGISTDAVLGGAEKTFLTLAERDDINKGAAHLTERLTLDIDSEFDLQYLVERSMPVFERLSSELRKADTKGEAKHWLDKTDALLKLARKQTEQRKKNVAARSVATATAQPG